MKIKSKYKFIRKDPDRKIGDSKEEMASKCI